MNFDEVLDIKALKTRKGKPPKPARHPEPKRDLIGMITGAVPLPDQFYITDACKHDHFHLGKTLRYISNGQCVVCNRKAKRKQNIRAGKFEKWIFYGLKE